MSGQQIERAPAHVGRAIFLLAIACFASAATTRICDALLPQLAADFRVTPGEAASVVTAYSLTYGLMQPFFGIAGDRFGKFRTILVCGVLSLVSTAACAAAHSLHALTIARLAAGFAAAGIVPLSIAWIGDNVPYAARQTTIAQLLTGQVSGVIAGLAFGGWFGQLFGWRSTFLIILAIYVVATFGLTLELRGSARTGDDRSTSGLGPLVLAFVKALRRPKVQLLMFAVFCEGFLCFGAVAYITTMLHRRFGMGYGSAGLMLAAFGLGGALYALFARRIVPRFGEQGVARIAGVLCFIAFLALAATPSPLFAAPACLLCGAGYYLLHSVLQVNATQLTPESRGAGVSMFATSFFVGQGLGVAAAAPFVDRFGAAPVFVVAAFGMPALAFWVASRIAVEGARS